MSTKAEKKKKSDQNTSSSSRDKNKHMENEQQKKKGAFKEGQEDNDGWSDEDDIENGADQRQEPEIDTPAHQPEKTEKKIPNMRNGL